MSRNFFITAFYSSVKGKMSDLFPKKFSKKLHLFLCRVLQPRFIGLIKIATNHQYILDSGIHYRMETTF